MRLKVSVPTVSLHKDLRQAIALAMQSGADGVQFDLRTEVVPRESGDSARRQLRHLLTERNLELASVHFPLRGPLTDRDRMDQRLAAIAEAINFASQIKVRTFTLRPGSIPPDGNPEREILIQVLNELAAQGDRLGVAISLIPSGDSAADLKQMLSQVTSGWISVDADLAEWVLNQQSCTSELRELFGSIGHIEGRDAARGYSGSGREVPLGRGEIDWDEIVALLTEMDYVGWINVTRTTGQTIADDIVRGVKFLQERFTPGRHPNL